MAHSGVRDRPKLGAFDYETLVKNADAVEEKYDASKDTGLALVGDAERMPMANPLFQKGQSKRIWGELYKVRLCGLWRRLIAHRCTGDRLERRDCASAGCARPHGHALGIRRAPFAREVPDETLGICTE